MSDSGTPRNAPFVVDETPGKKAWCACGSSQNMPYCDGSHAGTDKRPLVVEIEEARKVAWCGCHKTCSAPYCDGSHKNG